MKITDPIILNGVACCPRCEVELRHVKAECEGVHMMVPAYSECPSCDWQPGEEINACTYCGKVTDELVKSDDGDDYCVKCKRQEDITSAVQSIMAAAIAINMQTPYCAFVDYFGHINSIHIYLTPNKKAGEERIASQNINLPYDDAIDTLKRVHQCLAEIAVTGKIPPLKEHPQKYIFPTWDPILEIDTKAMAI